MQKESLLASMPKLIMAVSLIVCMGALLGAVGYLAKNKEIQKTAIKKSVDAINKDLTVESLKNAEYNSIFWKNETIKLKDGSYTREYPDSVSVGYLGIFDDKILFGDLNGDGEKDAVIILDSSFGGTGHFYELAVIVNKNGELLQIASEDLGDRSIINSLKISDGKIIIDIIVHGLDDGGCCPTLRKIIKYKLSEDQLIEATEDENANWKTYRNEELEFEIRYPDFFSVTEKSYGKEISFIAENKYACVANIEILEENIDSYDESLQSNEMTKIISKKDIFLNDYKGREIRSETSEMGLLDICVLLFHNYKTYKICSCEESDMEEIFNQILSTFKFIEK